MTQSEEQFLSERLSEDLENLERYVEEFSVFLPLPICMVNPSGIIVDVNQAAVSLLGWGDIEVIGQGLEFLFKNKKKAKFFLDQVFEKELVKNYQLVLVNKQKKEIPVNISGSVRKDQEGNVIGCFVAISDITELKKLQEELEEKVAERTKELEATGQQLQKMLKESRRSEKALANIVKDLDEAKEQVQEEKNKTQAALKSLVDGLIVFDKDKKISLINPEAEKILEVKQKQILGKRLKDLKNHPKVFKLYQTLGNKLEWTGQRYEFVLEQPLKRYYQVAITPVTAREKNIGLMVVMHDITRDKEIERLKTEFVSIAAHQLRTPLSAIKWTLKMLLDGDVGEVSEEQRSFLEKGYESNERMINLINDLLNVARIEEGRFLYELEEVSLVEIVEKIINLVKSAAKQKKIKLNFKKPVKKIPLVKVDEEKIELVVQNLLDNAIRYSKAGGEVTVSVEYDKMGVRVMIQDSGIGIPEKQQNRLFKKFFRADNAVKKKTEGTGLGLFICKNIIEAHGGKIWFESEIGKGTTFWFVLPDKK